MPIKTTARVHLLTAKEAPYVVIIRRKPSKTYHIIRWNTQSDKFEHGSWFTGHIYVDRSDVSFDGKWMVYLARGAKGNTWNGVCLLPFLKTYFESEALDTWGGGGYWKNAKTLITDAWETHKGMTPFRVEDGTGQGEVHVQRMKRDGWTHNQAERKWIAKFDKKSVSLEAIYRRHTADFVFRVPEYPDFLDDDVESATFDALGNLIFTRGGMVYKYDKKALKRGRPSFTANLNSLTRENIKGAG